MAKIILVSKQVTATSWQLAQALKAQQHEVILLTSYGEFAPDTTGIHFMAYFRNWGVLEGLRIIPGLFGLHPQILHLVLEEDRMNPAQMILSTFAKSHPVCILTTSLLNIKYGLKRRNPVRYLIEESDIITCPTVETLGQIRGLNVRSTRQGRGILPPVLDLKSSIDEEELLDACDGKLLDVFCEQPFVIVPFREPKFDSHAESFIRIRTLALKYRVLLLGSYSHWTVRERKKFTAWMEEYGCGDKWMVTGLIPSNLIRSLLEKSSAFVLAGQPLTPVEMTEYYMRAIQTQAVLVLDSKQTSIHSDLWKDNVNCWVLNHQQIQRDLIKLVNRPNLDLPEVLSEQITVERHLIDSSLNELNRLYNRALSHIR